MQENFKINVTRLVKKVKELNLLFYPVIMHIFAQALKIKGNIFKFSAYLNTLNADDKCILYQALEADFNAYFETYVRNCFCNLPNRNLPPNTVLFYPDNFGIIDKSYQNVPTFLIYEIENINDEQFLKFSTLNINLETNFANLCEELADLF